MAERSKLKQRNALKHGAYSTIGLLPSESPALFKKISASMSSDQMGSSNSTSS
jgi:hypothetical protein